MLISTVVFLFFLFLVYAVFLFASRKSDARQEQLQQRVAEALQGLGPIEEIQISRTDSIGGNPALNRLLSSLDLTRKIDQMIRQADVRITVTRLLFFSLLAAAMGFLAAATIFNLIFAIIVAAAAGSLPLFSIHQKRKKRLRLFNAQLPDTLDLLSRSLAVGHAFSESLHQVASEMPDPVSTEFRIAFEEQKLGLSTKQALDRLTERIPLPDLRLSVTAIQIQRDTGGNLAEILEKVSQTVRERFKLMEDFRTLTTSSRGSAWILCALPFLIILVMTLINPNYMTLLLHDQRGHYMLAVALLLQVLGILTIRAILNIKV